MSPSALAGLCPCTAHPATGQVRCVALRSRVYIRVAGTPVDPQRGSTLPRWMGDYPAPRGEGPSALSRNTPLHRLAATQRVNASDALTHELRSRMPQPQAAGAAARSHAPALCAVLGPMARSIIMCPSACASVSSVSVLRTVPLLRLAGGTCPGHRFSGPQPRANRIPSEHGAQVYGISDSGHSPPKTKLVSRRFSEG